MDALWYELGMKHNSTASLISAIVPLVMWQRLHGVERRGMGVHK